MCPARIGKTVLGVCCGVLLCALQAGAQSQVITWPYVDETVSPVEELTVISPTGFQCPVALRLPPGEGPFPLVVVIHGGTASHPIDRLRAMATTQHNTVRLLAAGYAIAVPSFSARAEDPQTTNAFRDCIAVIEHVRHLPRIASDSVFVFGGSGGGSLALELAGEIKLSAIAAGEPANVLFTGAWSTSTLSELEAIMADPLKYCDNAETREFTRAKIDKISCPVLIVHSDVHPINKINEVFVIPMMREAGKVLDICFVPDVKHGFYFASSERPDATLQAFQAIEGFFRRHCRTVPTPIAAANQELRTVSEGMTKESGAQEPKGARAENGTSLPDAGDIDWDRVRALRRRVLGGEKLSAEDQAYYERGVAAWPPRYYSGHHLYCISL